ncbi:MAG: hypothetical protein GH151_13110 [Bacteroidetes bacterium]|nr:hypothetical protein [Bacteroidota bacterium]
MYIERTNDEIIIRLPKSVNAEGLQRLVDYPTYLELTSKSKAKQTDIDQLADKINKDWWTKNKNRFVQ